MSQILDYLKTNPTFTPAVVCYLIKDDKIILGLRKKVSLGLGLNLISGIGGKVADLQGLENETFEEALIREVREEISVDVTSFEQVADIKFLFPNKTKWNQHVMAYLVTNWIGDPQETESILPMEFDIEKVPFERMWDDNKHWLPLILEGKKLEATFMYDNENKTIIEKEISIIS